MLHARVRVAAGVVRVRGGVAVAAGAAVRLHLGHRVQGGERRPEEAQRQLVVVEHVAGGGGALRGRAQVLGAAGADAVWPRGAVEVAALVALLAVAGRVRARAVHGTAPLLGRAQLRTRRVRAVEAVVVVHQRAVVVVQHVLVAVAEAVVVLEPLRVLAVIITQFARVVVVMIVVDVAQVAITWRRRRRRRTVAAACR